jgi:hypothetical protein
LLLFLSITVSIVGQTVYITRTGEKYHDGGCRYLRRSCIEISLANAIAQGYEPCSVCNPPLTVRNTQREPRPGTMESMKSSRSVRCSAITKKGNRCKRMTTNRDGLCWQHQ